MPHSFSLTTILERGPLSRNSSWILRNGFFYVRLSRARMGAHFALHPKKKLSISSPTIKLAKQNNHHHVGANTAPSKPRNSQKAKLDWQRMVRRSHGSNFWHGTSSAPSSNTTAWCPTNGPTAFQLLVCTQFSCSKCRRLSRNQSIAFSRFLGSKHS